MKVLLSAYACEPDRGSEPGVGFQTLLAVVQQHEVWLITRQNNIPSLSESLADHPRRDQIHLKGLDLPRWARWIKKRLGAIGQHWYYDRWQLAARNLAVELDRTVSFDVAHHVTFAAYWMRVGVANIGIPLVLGPLGGGTKTPLLLVPELGWAGILAETLRLVVRPVLARRRCVRRAIAGAQVVFVQNPATAALVGRMATPTILPNALIVLDDTEQRRFEKRSSTEILVVGRLVPLKGGSLAVRALAALDESRTLRFIGDGPDRERLVRLARRLGVSARVQLAGAIPREQVMDHLTGAGVLLHSALHDEAPLGVAEALTLGTPVVCLAGAGPEQIASYWPRGVSRVVKPRGRRGTVAGLARAVEDLLSGDAHTDVGSHVPVIRFGEQILVAYGKVARSS